MSDIPRRAYSFDDHRRRRGTSRLACCALAFLLQARQQLRKQHTTIFSKKNTVKMDPDCRQTQKRDLNRGCSSVVAGQRELHWHDWPGEKLGRKAWQPLPQFSESLSFRCCCCQQLSPYHSRGGDTLAVVRLTLLHVQQPSS